MREVRVGQRILGDQAPVYIIAEMACAHDGSLDNARQLIDAAVQSGADAVQLQFFSTEHLVTPHHQVYDLLKRIEFTEGQWRELYAYARGQDADVFACTFDIPSLQLAIELGVDGIKLNSSDLSYPEMLELIAKSGVFFTLGTGASTIEEVSEALDIIESNGGYNLAIMHGVQNFPTPLADAHINRVRILRSLFEYPIGYADHTDASLKMAHHVDYLALGCGARILEKHITISRQDKGTDYQAALEPKEFKEYIQKMKDADIALGPLRPNPLSTADKEYRRFQKKSIVAAKDIPAGATLTSQMLACLRTGTEPGMAPNQLPNILGRKTNTGIRKFDKITIDMIE